MWILQKMSSSSIRWSMIMREDLRVFFLDAQGSRYVFLQLLKVVSLPLKKKKKTSLKKAAVGDYRPGQAVGRKITKFHLWVWLPSGL